MMVNTVTVRWHDGYLEEFRATEVRFGSDLLWLRLEDGKNRHIPLRSVRWFGLSVESHQTEPPLDGKYEKALAKLRDYEARKKAEAEAVKVGDEVALLSEPGGKLIVTAIRRDGRYSGIITDGLVLGGLPPGSFQKTGRHFPEIAAVLEQMKGE